MRQCRAIACLLGMAVVLAGCADGSWRPRRPARSEVPPSALADFNRGAARMEQYRYPEAATAFEKVLRAAPGWNAARFNLGLAYLNMQGQRGAQASLQAAREALEAACAAEPTHLHARFCLGLYHQHLGENEQALACFQAVRESDRHDPHVAYKCAEPLIALGRNEEGVRLLEEVVAADPGFISAVYRLALQYQRGGKTGQAAKLFERFKTLSAAELAGGSFTVQKSYGTAGRYSQVLGADGQPPPLQAPAARRIVFSPEVRRLDAPSAAWNWGNGTVGLPGLAVGDVDGDGDLDLCLCEPGGQGSTRIWLNDGAGNFTPGPELCRHGVSPCFGDVDNDGQLDLWLGRAGQDLLFTNDGKGSFRTANLPATAGPAALTACARLIDLDSDGDLDLLAFRLGKGNVPAGGGPKAAPCSVYNNHRDGSYSDIAAALGLAFAGTPVAAVVFDDFDNDRDLDALVFPADGGEPIAWVNDRGGKYHLLDAAATGLTARGVVSAVSGDPDKDGNRDLLLFSEKGVALWLNDGRFHFGADRLFADAHGWLGGTGGQFVDMDNDGDLDIVIPDAHRRDGGRGPVVLVNDWPRPRFLSVAEIDPGNLLSAIRFPGDASGVAADFDGDGRCDLLLAPIGERPMLITNATPGGHWIELDLRGVRERDNKVRSNGSAIGARVEIKAGASSQQFVVGGAAGPVAMSPLRIHAGLGGHPQVEWLRVVWPDAVLQAELELAADRVAMVAELERKTSSCPYLFAWNGSQFEFVADFGGVGGLGYLVAPGTYAPVDSTEYVPIPRLEPRNGEFVVQALTPLEEVTYFDEAKLIAVDHPEGTEVWPNEMMAVNAPLPPFELFCFRSPIEPVRAVDHRGADVTAEVLRVDRRYAGATRPDPRFIGLADDHFVELDFGDRLRGVAPGRRLVLFLFGWVEYGYSSTNFAASQAGLRTKAPSIHALRDGRWVELFHEVGYPAGVQHVMTLELTGKLLPSDRRLRISSNMELYWDRIFLAEHLGDAPLSVREVAAASADLHFRGYPREYSPDGRQPNLYDYGNSDTTTTWKRMAGQYTRYGEVAELLAKADDCYAIMGHGDELTLRFPAAAFGPVPPGRRRTFLLKTDSFCKDMDLYTAHPDTVEPLPFHAMSGYPYRPDERYPESDRTRQYRRQFNTRLVGPR